MVRIIGGGSAAEAHGTASDSIRDGQTAPHFRREQAAAVDKQLASGKKGV